jgi:dipeptidyl aminopeptidase/acylaminoacyl peptidase
MFRAGRAAPALLVALVAASPPAARAQQAAPPPAAAPRAADRIQLEQYLDWEDVQSPQVSPDGARIIFTRRWVDKMNDRWETSLWQMNADGSQLRGLTQGSDAQWSPDGKRIAYVARGEPNNSAQIFVRWMDAEGATTQISHLTEAPSGLEWAPDGKSIAFTMNVPTRDGWRIAMPTPPRGAKWTESPKVNTRLNYRSDRVGYIDESYRHVFLIPADGGTPRQITTGDYSHSAPSFSPDGKWVAFSGNRVPDSERIARRSQIYAASLETGEIRQLTSTPGSNGSPAYAPNGRQIAYLAADSSNPNGYPDTKLRVMNADGSSARVVTGALDRPVSNPIWSADGASLYFMVDSAGSRNLYVTTAAGGQPRALTAGAHVLAVSAVARNGLAVGTRSTPTKPNDVVAFSVPKAGAVTAYSQLTSVNDDVLAGKQLAQTEEVWYTSKDGLRVQGWIVKPPGFDPSRKYPLMLDIHGGPWSMYNVGFSFARQDHAADGYVVLYTNPRGSTGYGIKFTREITNAYPGKDFDDLMAGVDTLLGRGYVDPKRLFVYGCSGGGVLTAWIVGHTDRFAGAASLCPVTNWMSFVGTTDGASWYENFEKPFWEDPSEYLRRSPIMYVGNVKTPTLLMTGVLDLRTPMPQSEEFYRALKYRGVPTALVRMNNEYHGTSSIPSNFLRTQLYIRSWFDRWSGGQRPTAAAMQ